MLSLSHLLSETKLEYVPNEGHLLNKLYNSSDIQIGALYFRPAQLYQMAHIWDQRSIKLNFRVQGSFLAPTIIMYRDRRKKRLRLSILAAKRVAWNYTIINEICLTNKGKRLPANEELLIMASSSSEEQSEVGMEFVQNMQSDLVFHVVAPFYWHVRKRKC